MTNKKLDIANIAGIEEINDTIAANCNGGFDIELFFDSGFPSTSGNDGLGADNSQNNLADTSLVTNVNNQVSSVRVNEGTWRLYGNAFFGGTSVEVGPGEYNQSFLTNNGLNDNISSILRID